MVDDKQSCENCIAGFLVMCLGPGNAHTSLVDLQMTTKKYIKVWRLGIGADAGRGGRIPHVPDVGCDVGTAMLAQGSHDAATAQTQRSALSPISNLSLLLRSYCII
jgi:hypothetical protein